MAKRVIIGPETAKILSRWYPPQLVQETRFLQGSLFGRLFGRWGQGAVTIGRTVHLTPRAGDLASHGGIALLAHELYHVAQQTEMGWWPFFVRYAVRWRPSHRKEGWRHPMEEPAYRRADEVRRVLDEMDETNEGQG